MQTLQTSIAVASSSSFCLMFFTIRKPPNRVNAESDSIYQPIVTENTQTELKSKQKKRFYVQGHEIEHSCFETFATEDCRLLTMWRWKIER